MQHAELLDELSRLNEQLASAQDAVKREYLACHKTVGRSFHGFAVKSTRSVDANLLVQLEPDTLSLVKFTMAVGELEKYVEAGLISEQLADEVTHETVSIAAPRK